MDKAGMDALRQVDIAEAELAVLKQESLLRQLLADGEPTVEAEARLEGLRRTVADLSVRDHVGFAGSAD
jgi:hypothetical protein